jgi:murein DD-endopeptidase MepM/ murein hydrolase activator NlpD
MRLFILFSVCCLAGCAASKDPRREEVHRLQKGKIKEDSSYVYDLPFEKGRSHLVVQGYFSHFSHKNRIAVDIKMKKGTKICAASDGVVIRMVENNTRGGWSKKNLPYANLIVIQHENGMRTGYWHLQHNGAWVKVGDMVRRGQVIGLSGRTGYSAFPHLHFMAWKHSPDGPWQQVPTRFQTSRGILYLRPGKWYRK